MCRSLNKSSGRSFQLAGARGGDARELLVAGGSSNVCWAHEFDAFIFAFLIFFFFFLGDARKLLGLFFFFFAPKRAEKLRALKIPW